MSDSTKPLEACQTLAGARRLKRDYDCQVKNMEKELVAKAAEFVWRLRNPGDPSLEVVALGYRETEETRVRNLCAKFNLPIERLFPVLDSMATVDPKLFAELIQ